MRELVEDAPFPAVVRERSYSYFFSFFSCGGAGVSLGRLSIALKRTSPPITCSAQYKRIRSAQCGARTFPCTSEIGIEEHSTQITHTRAHQSGTDSTAEMADSARPRAELSSVVSCAFSEIVACWTLSQKPEIADSVKAPSCNDQRLRLPGLNAITDGCALISKPNKSES